MTPLVVDPSAVLALALDDEVADFADRVVDRIAAESAQVPAIFWYELRNVLVVNERRRRIRAEQTSAFLATLSVLPIEISALPADTGVLSLARQYGLSVYDAAYLDLALDRGFPLATLDEKLRQAAPKAGVEVFS